MHFSPVPSSFWTPQKVIFLLRIKSKNRAMFVSHVPVSSCHEFPYSRARGPRPRVLRLQVPLSWVPRPRVHTLPVHTSIVLRVTESHVPSLTREVSNGPIQFESARKIGFCANCWQKLNRSSLARARKIFAAAGMLGFLLKFPAV